MPTTVEETPKDLKTKTPTSKEARVAELLEELDGKSETTQRPVIDEIVALGQIAIKPLSKALGSGASFQVRMASATGLGELGSDKCVFAAGRRAGRFQPQRFNAPPSPRSHFWANRRCSPFWNRSIRPTKPCAVGAPKCWDVWAARKSRPR